MRKKRGGFLIVLFLVLIFILIDFSSAASYGSGLYGLGAYGIAQKKVECTFKWVCSAWYPSPCITGIQKRICVNIGTCSGKNKIPKLTRTCTSLWPWNIFGY